MRFGVMVCITELEIDRKMFGCLDLCVPVDKSNEPDDICVNERHMS